MCLRLPVIPVFIQQGRRGERSLQALGAACLQQVSKTPAKTNYRVVFKAPHVHSSIHTHFLFLPPKTLLMTKQTNKQQQKYTKHTTAENNILSQIFSVCFQCSEFWLRLPGRLSRTEIETNVSFMSYRSKCRTVITAIYPTNTSALNYWIDHGKEGRMTFYSEWVILCLLFCYFSIS